MEQMNMYMKKAARITGAFCAATGMLALSSVVICGAAVGATVGMAKYAKDTVKKILNDQSQKTDDIDEDEILEVDIIENDASEADADKNETIKIED